MPLSPCLRQEQHFCPDGQRRSPGPDLCQNTEEQKKMRISSAINDKAMAKFKGLIHEGVSEKEVADQMLQIYLDLGADGYSFEPLVAFGANAADPHHSPDDTVENLVTAFSLT